MAAVQQTITPAFGEEYRRRWDGAKFRLVGRYHNALEPKSETETVVIPEEWLWRQFIHSKARRIA